MELIVGLGNPGRRYLRTRHNAGFRVVDRLVEIGSGQWRKGNRFLWTSQVLEDHPVFLLKPLTFMNLSGEGLYAFLERHQGSRFEVLVIHDELDLPPGAVRIKKGGGTAGHRGLNSLVDFLERKDFVRVRVGIGRPPLAGFTADYVLGTPLGEEGAHLAEGEHQAVQAVRSILRDGLEAAMNRYNRRKAEEAEDTVC